MTDSPRNQRKMTTRTVSDIGIVIPDEVTEWEKERTELKSKIEELEAFKSKYEEEKQQKERLQRQVDSLSISQSDASQKLVKAGELNERLRQDNKKKNRSDREVSTRHSILGGSTPQLGNQGF